MKTPYLLDGRMVNVYSLSDIEAMAQSKCRDFSHEKNMVDL